MIPWYSKTLFSFYNLLFIMNSFWIGKAVHSKMEFLELLRGGLKLWASPTQKSHLKKYGSFLVKISFRSYTIIFGGQTYPLIFLDTQVSLAPTPVRCAPQDNRCAPVRHTFGFPFCQGLWLPFMKSWRKRTPIIFQFQVWVGFPEIGPGGNGKKK